jgi:hypothetical protein
MGMGMEGEGGRGEVVIHDFDIEHRTLIETLILTKNLRRAEQSRAELGRAGQSKRLDW